MKSVKSRLTTSSEIEGNIKRRNIMKLLTEGTRKGRKSRTAPESSTITSAPLQKSLTDAGIRAIAQHGIKVEIRFNLNAEGAKSVAVAGSFNDWNPDKTRLKKDGQTWRTNLWLP